jgi:hypothetical protein
MSSGIKMSVLLFSFAFVSVLSVNIDNEKTDVYIKPNNISNENPVEYKLEEFNITEPLYIVVPKDINESFIGPPIYHNINRKLLENSENIDSNEDEDVDSNEDEDIKSGNRRLLRKLKIKISNPFKSKKSSPPPAPKPANVIIKAVPVLKPSPVVIKATPSPKPTPVVKPSKLKTTIKNIIPKVENKVKTSTKKVISKLKSSSKKIVSKIKKVIPKVNGIKIYGNFCGPNYCGGQKFKGAEGPKCLWGVSPKDSLDECCKLHDKCCGFSGTRGTKCNKEILSCVNKVKCKNGKCNFSKALIKSTFSAIKNKVCGNIFGRKKQNKSVENNIKINPKVGKTVQQPVVSQLKNTKPSTSTIKISPTDGKTIKENPTNSFSSEVNAKNNLISPEKANNEIHDSISKTNNNLESFKAKIISFMTEMENSEKTVEIKNKNDYNDVKSSIKHEELRLEESKQLLKNLYNEAENLNITIQTHYKKLLSDTEYLKTLDLMRPAFLKSLDELSLHIEAVKNVVNQKIVKDEYKDEMLSLLTGIHFNTHNISGYVATAFINHYNKFKNSIKIEDTTYLTEMKKLTLLSQKYKEQEKKITELENERTRLENILEKLKKTLLLSETQKNEFNLMFNEIISLFNGISNRCN